MSDAQETSKLAVELYNKYGKATMSIVLAGMMRHAKSFRINKIVEEQLEGQKDIKLKHLKDIAEGKV